MALLAAFSAHADPLPAGFVRLADVDPTIRQDIRYAGLENFLQRKVDGYEAPVCILTAPAAKALSVVQKATTAEGLTLIVFDCYRPARAVADMGRWTRQGGPPDPQWYPKVDRGDLISEAMSANCPATRAARPLTSPSLSLTRQARLIAPAARLTPAPSLRHRIRLFRSGERDGPPPPARPSSGKPHDAAFWPCAPPASATMGANGGISPSPTSRSQSSASIFR
ncbi:M15 family metallopeptidase [Mesorhizobium sp. WSM3866]|uniref:M15 family metallopeptidase n=1 Tax=Mesorhizobium sp. WSM3866 TaxID=422271 RepID=UPI001FDEC40F|nr:M15 family metallopeptidase [Mesorhizobium sp. WSM3866]